METDIGHGEDYSVLQDWDSLSDEKEKKPVNVIEVTGQNFVPGIKTKVIELGEPANIKTLKIEFRNYIS